MTGRTGRPPLTERRKAALRLEIAREAVRLFNTRGIATTTAEEIANAAGISVRTLWRFVPGKEWCVYPLLTAGIEAAARSLRAWQPGEGVAALIDDMEQAGREVAADVPMLLGLVRLARTEPGLRAVWLQAHDDAERAFAVALGQRAGLAADSLRIRVQAAMVNGALRAAAECCAGGVTPGREADASYEDLIGAIRSAFLTAARGLPD
jgi:AcrR family transcriptional regulator